MALENGSGRKKVVELKYVIDDKDVGEVAHFLSKVLSKDTSDGTPRRSQRKQNLSLSKSDTTKHKSNPGIEDNENTEVQKLMDEELPEEFMLPTPNELSEGLLHKEGETLFDFNTPKKRRGMTLKAQESVNKYHATPTRNETPLKPRTSERKGFSDDVLTPTKTPVKSVGRTTKSRISFGAEMGPTPSKGNVLNGTPTKSALKSARRSLLEKPETPTRHIKVNGENTPKRALKRIASNEDLTSRTPTRRQSIAIKSMETIEEHTTSVPKTPHTIRLRTKACINTAIKNSLIDDSESEDSVEDFSSDDEEDEYKPNVENESSEEESESDNEENSESDEEYTKSHVKNRKGALTLVVNKDQTAVTPSRSKRREVKYEFSTDAYFETFASKDITSNNTLSRLSNPRLREETLRELLKNTDDAHKEPMATLTQESHTLFHRWLFTLREGFNILLFGLGSKRHLLQSLHDEMLCDSQVLVVNGFFPGLTVKEILDTILTGLLGARDAPANPLEAVELVEKIQSSRNADTLYLLIHNLDGPTLKNNKAQTVLSKLAKIPKVRVIASIDHINAPLMWDQTKLRRFNFSWWDVTTFMPYTVETSFESSLLIQRSGALQLSSLHSVFKSLTTNAKKVYLIIAKKQLENAGDRNYSGLSFQDLYWEARNAYLVSTDMALRAQLTEFLDHRMIKMKRGGEELLTIPIDNTIIQQFVQSQEDKEDQI